MLVCNISQRPPRRAIAAELAETAAAVDDFGTGNIVFATLVDDPASVGETVDAYLGEIMLEAATAIDNVSAPTVSTVTVAEAAAAADAQDGTATSGFLPSQLATLRLWLKGDTLTGTNGSAIATWPDASGTGNNATQATTAKQPTLAVAHQNGLNVVRFTAANSNVMSLPASAFSSFSEGAVIFVARLVTDPGATGSQDAGLFKFGNDAQNNHYPYGGDGNIYDDFASNSRKNVGNPTPSLANYHIGGFRSKAADWRYFLNGTQFFNTTSNAVTWTAAPVIGAFSALGAILFDGYIAETILLNEFASTSDWQKLEGYLAWKWNLQSELPAGHPYKSTPP